MGNCDMCGKEGHLFTSKVEGCFMKVCKSCGSFGEKRKTPSNQNSRFSNKKREYGRDSYVEKREFKRRDNNNNNNNRQNTNYKRPNTHKNPEPKTKTEMVTSLIEDYNKVLRKKRETMSMTQKQFARFVNLKESIIHKIETASFELPIEMAKQLEKSLKIKLVQEKEEEIAIIPKPNMKKASAGLTLGDFIKIKKR